MTKSVQTRNYCLWQSIQTLYQFLCSKMLQIFIWSFYWLWRWFFFFFIIRSMMIRSNWNWLRRLFLYMNSTCAEGKWICVVNIYMEIAIRNVTIKLTFHLDALILGENCRFMIYVNKSEKNKKKKCFLQISEVIDEAKTKRRIRTI